jgi:hypothetical protein
MSLTERRTRSAPAEPFAAPPPSAGRQTERRERRRRRIHRRQDVAIGVLVAVVALVLGPGLAVVAIGALIVLLVCAVSFALARSRGRRAGSRRSRRLDRRR